MLDSKLVAWEREKRDFLSNLYIYIYIVGVVVVVRVLTQVYPLEFSDEEKKKSVLLMMYLNLFLLSFNGICNLPNLCLCFVFVF